MMPSRRGRTMESRRCPFAGKNNVSFAFSLFVSPAGFVYSASGLPLETIPLPHFADEIRSRGNRVCLLDKDRGVIYRRYVIEAG